MSDDDIPLVEWYADLSWLNPNHGIPIFFQSKMYPSVRNAFEATKFPNPRDREWLETVGPWQAAKACLEMPVDAYRGEWESKINDWLLYFLAQKFGLVRLTKNSRQSVLMGYWLACTSPRPLVYTNCACDTVLGKCFCRTHSEVKIAGYGCGSNLIGQLMEGVRTKLSPPRHIDDLMGLDCDWCFNNKRHHKSTVATSMMIWTQSGQIHRRAVCERHRGIYSKEASIHADNDEHFTFAVEETPDPDKNFSFTWRKQSTAALVTHSNIRPAPPGWSPSSSSSWSSNWSNTDKTTWGLSRLDNKDFNHLVMGVAG